MHANFHWQGVYRVAGLKYPVAISGITDIIADDPVKGIQINMGIDRNNRICITDVIMNFVLGKSITGTPPFLYT